MNKIEIEAIMTQFDRKCEYERGEDSSAYTKRCRDFLQRALTALTQKYEEEKAAMVREVYTGVIDYSLIGIHFMRGELPLSKLDAAHGELMKLVEKYGLEPKSKYNVDLSKTDVTTTL